MASQSPEWYAMVECHHKLTLALSADILNISGRLLVGKVISNEVHEKMLLSGLTPMEKANHLVQAVRAATESSRKKFTDFIDVISEQPVTEDIAKTLKTTYESHLNKDLKNTENQDSPEYSLVTEWSEVITNVISQNILKIAEAVSKEALISSDIISRVTITDGLPLEKAEILFQALKKEIKKDSNVLHKFMAILSTYGSGEDKFIMQTLKNYLSSNKLEDSDHDSHREESTDSNDVKLMKAVMEGDTEYVRHLLRLGTININHFIKFNHDDPPITLLQAACARGSCEIVELLIEFDADVNKLSRNDGSPLMVACQCGHAKVVKKLLRHGARVDIGLVESGDVPAIFKATAAGYTEVVKILLEHDSTLASLQTLGGYTCLPSACSNGSTEIAKLLLEYGAPVNIIADDGSLSLKEASKFGYADIVELLLQHSAQIDLHTRDGMTALISACEAGHTKVVKILLEHGANTSLVAKNGKFALERASKMGYCAIVKLLIKHKANVNMANQIGWTALMMASIQGHFKIAKLLLKAGADIKIRARDPERHTAIEFATQNGNTEIVNLLSGRPTMKEAFISLLPLAAKWKTIGFLLDLDDKSLAGISCSTDEEALRLMLQIWLKTPRPSWETLAEAIEPLDGNIAENINSY